MTRRLLASVMTLGLLVTALGFSGIYAVFTDSATTGENSVTTGEEPRVADIRIALVASADLCADATYLENLTTGLISATDVRPEWVGDKAYVCIRNVGSADVDLAWKVIDIVDEDVACTGDEAAAGDATCGAAAEGELSAHLYVEEQKLSCSTGVPQNGRASSLALLAQYPVAPGIVQAGETQCFSFNAYYPMPNDPLDAQRAQSDRVTWRFAFDATQVTPPAE